MTGDSDCQSVFCVLQKECKEYYEYYEYSFIRFAVKLTAACNIPATRLTGGGVETWLSATRPSTFAKATADETRAVSKNVPHRHQPIHLRQGYGGRDEGGE